MYFKHAYLKVSGGSFRISVLLLDEVQITSIKSRWGNWVSGNGCQIFSMKSLWSLCKFKTPYPGNPKPIKWCSAF